MLHNTSVAFRKGGFPVRRMTYTDWTRSRITSLSMVRRMFSNCFTQEGVQASLVTGNFFFRFSASPSSLCRSEGICCSRGVEESCSLALREPKRFWSKPKKRPKVGTGFHEKAQKWRDEYLLDRHRVLADSMRAYVDFSSTRRADPWDTRFAPFDRIPRDGVYILTQHLMEEKLQLCSYHHRPVKRLCCNVGLMGPQVTTTARWKPARYATNPSSATKAERIFQRDKTVQTGYHHD